MASSRSKKFVVACLLRADERGPSRKMFIHPERAPNDAIFYEFSRLTSDRTSSETSFASR